MSCNDNPNILPNNCKLVPNCEDISVEFTTLESHGCTKRVGRHGKTIVKVPKFLASVKLQTCIVDDVTIPEGFTEIKNIGKKVIVNQCKLVCDHLIVEGYILKNVSYVTPENVDVDTERCIAYRNSWRDIELKVPFSICMKVKHLPHYTPHWGARHSKEVPFKCNTMKNKCCDNGFMGDSLCETVREDFAFLNETPHCDLVAYHITEIDINRKPCETEAPGNLYGVFTEKLLLTLFIEIFVDDYVRIKHHHHYPAPGAPVVGENPQDEEVEDEIDLEYDEDNEFDEEEEEMNDVDIFNGSFERFK